MSLGRSPGCTMAFQPVASACAERSERISSIVGPSGSCSSPMAETNVSELRTIVSVGSSPRWMATSDEPSASSPPMVTDAPTGSISKGGAATMAMSETSADAGTVTVTVSGCWMSKSKNSLTVMTTVASSTRSTLAGWMPGRMMLFQPVSDETPAVMPLIRSVVGPSPKSSAPTASTHVSPLSVTVTTIGLPAAWEVAWRDDGKACRG